MKIKILSVSEVNKYLKKTLDNDFILRNLSVKGEVSNLKYHSSGHIYFSLKDGQSRLSCVMFRTFAETLNFKIKEGMSIIASGSISLYKEAGSVQLYVQQVQEEGLGKLYIEFEKLKNKLSEKGLFDDKYKKEIPRFSKNIGVITSETGAVFHDIINVTRTRNSLVDIILYPARVQGNGAYKDIIEGLKYFNKNKNVDVIIVGRGGGSIEELWNFNEEELACYIFKSKIPVISAVGHEVDFTICDFVSDKRASTPSHAAEMAVPLEADMYSELSAIKNNLNNIIKEKLQKEKSKVQSLAKILSLNSPKAKIANSYLKVDKLNNNLNVVMNKKLALEKEKINGLNKLLISKNPCSILSKGYAIIEGKDGVNINSISSLEQKKEINIILKDGKVFGEFIPKTNK